MAYGKRISISESAIGGYGVGYRVSLKAAAWRTAKLAGGHRRRQK
jgi:hypothetical protein